MNLNYQNELVDYNFITLSAKQEFDEQAKKEILLAIQGQAVELDINLPVNILAYAFVLALAEAVEIVIRLKNGKRVLLFSRLYDPLRPQEIIVEPLFLRGDDTLSDEVKSEYTLDLSQYKLKSNDDFVKIRKIMKNVYQQRCKCKKLNLQGDDSKLIYLLTIFIFLPLVDSIYINNNKIA